MQKRMSKEEWRLFVGNMTAGAFGGIVVLGWSEIYESVKGSNLLVQVLAPLLSSLVLYLFFILILYGFLVDRGASTRKLEAKDR